MERFGLGLACGLMLAALVFLHWQQQQIGGALGQLNARIERLERGAQ